MRLQWLRLSKMAPREFNVSLRAPGANPCAPARPVFGEDRKAGSERRRQVAHADTVEPVSTPKFPANREF